MKAVLSNHRQYKEKQLPYLYYGKGDLKNNIFIHLSDIFL